MQKTCEVGIGTGGHRRAVGGVAGEDRDPGGRKGSLGCAGESRQRVEVAGEHG